MTPSIGKTTSRDAAVIPPARTPAKAFPRSIQSPCCTCTARHLGTTATAALPGRRRAYTHHTVIAPPSLRQSGQLRPQDFLHAPALGAAGTPPGQAAASHTSLAPPARPRASHPGYSTTPPPVFTRSPLMLSPCRRRDGPPSRRTARSQTAATPQQAVAALSPSSGAAHMLKRAHGRWAAATSSAHAYNCRRCRPRPRNHRIMRT